MATNDHVTVIQRGRYCALGRGLDYFGIWDLDSTSSAPREYFPLDPSGWYWAWTRFREFEQPTDAPLGPQPIVPEVAAAGVRTRALVVAASLLVFGVGVGVASLFPVYLSGSSLASQNDELIAHALSLAGWLLAAVLCLSGTRHARGGAMLAVGLSIVTFGFYLGDAGSALSGNVNAVGTGLYLGIIGWAMCAAGSVGALAAQRSRGALGAPVPERSATLVAGVVLAIGVVATFAPSWDRFSLFAAATGQQESVTAGDAFLNPALVIVANVAIMVLVVALAAVALSWRPRALGAWLLAGAMIPMVGQAISALAQLSSNPGPAQFGITASQATQAHLQITTTLTPIFYLYCAFIAALAALALGTSLRSSSRAGR